MRKVPTLYVRDPDDRAHVLIGQVTPGCEWVLAGEGEATRKYDGTCTAYAADTNLSLALSAAFTRNEREAGPCRWWARREVKPGRPAPDGFLEVDRDATTGKQYGWEPVEQSPFVKQHAEAVTARAAWPRDTYELCGPKINGNPEGYGRHTLMSHFNAERARWDGATPEELVGAVAQRGWEGIVWHHDDGRMCKLKARDLSLLS